VDGGQTSPSPTPTPSAGTTVAPPADTATPTPTAPADGGPDLTQTSTYQNNPELLATGLPGKLPVSIGGVDQNPATDRLPAGTGTGTGGGSIDDLLGGTSSKSQFAQTLYTLYTNLWGQPPPPNWVQKHLDSGKNLFEIEAEIRANPLFAHTKTFEDEASGYAAQLARTLGFR
jgi:hypothetical protein